MALEPQQIDEIIKLANGQGLISPTGKQQWSTRELGGKFGVSHARISQILKERNAKPDRSINTQVLREAEAGELTFILDRLRKELGTRDLSKANLYHLAATYKNLSEERRKNEQGEKVEDLMRVALMELDQLTKKRIHENTKAQNKKIVEADFKEVPKEESDE